MKSYITEEQIKTRIKELANEISKEIKEPFKAIALLKGSFMFMADLVRQFDHTIEVDFFQVSSYSGTQSTGSLDYQSLRLPKIKGKNILLVDDIIDTGLTLSQLSNLFLENGARKVYTCALLDKPSRRSVNFEVDFQGFEIEDKFVIGYGMDLDERFRNLPEIYIYEECTQEENI